MSRISFSRRAFIDIERLIEFQVSRNRDDAGATLDIIVNALEILRLHPYIGRPREHGLRELVISRGRTGYVALYEFQPARDEVVVHGIRHQLEAGYSTD